MAYLDKIKAVNKLPDPEDLTQDTGRNVEPYSNGLIIIFFTLWLLTSGGVQMSEREGAKILTQHKQYT